METKESIRPVLEVSLNTSEKTAIEKFQNVTLRPIIKLQHDLVVAFFMHYVQSKKIDLSALSELKKTELVYKIFKSDNALKTEVKGLIIGHFTVAEYENYLPIASDANKRIWAMVSQRLLSVYKK
jgi:hypothetical protein